MFHTIFASELPNIEGKKQWNTHMVANNDLKQLEIEVEKDKIELENLEKLQHSPNPVKLKEKLDRDLEVTKQRISNGVKFTDQGPLEPDIAKQRTSTGVKTTKDLDQLEVPKPRISDGMKSPKNLVQLEVQLEKDKSELEKLEKVPTPNPTRLRKRLDQAINVAKQWTQKRRSNSPDLGTLGAQLNKDKFELEKLETLQSPNPERVRAKLERDIDLASQQTQKATSV